MNCEAKACEKPRSQACSNKKKLSPEMQAEIKEAVHEAMREAMREALDETLMRYGLNVGDPHGQQTDFKYLHQQRVTSERISQHTRLAIITAFVSGAAATGWWILQHAFKSIN